MSNNPTQKQSCYLLIHSRALKAIIKEIKAQKEIISNGKTVTDLMQVVKAIVIYVTLWLDGWTSGPKGWGSIIVRPLEIVPLDVTLDTNVWLYSK